MRPRPSNDIAKRIREIMQKQKLTTKQVADTLNVTDTSVAHNINGNPTVKTLSKIANALKVPLWQFFISPDELSEALKDKEFAQSLGLTTLDTLKQVPICPSCGMPVVLKGIELK